MRCAAALTALMVVLGAADAASRPRSRFAAYIDPSLGHRKPHVSPRVSVAFVIGCSSGATAWLAAMRLQLARRLGNRVVAPIPMRVVVDCASGEADPCDDPIAPATPGELVVDFRCRAPTTAAVAAAIACGGYFLPLAT
jgi:hypothetical protein